MNHTARITTPGVVSASARPGRKTRVCLTTFSWEGAFANVFIILTGGAFLTSLGLHFGAGYIEIGLLGALPFLSQAAQLFSPLMIRLTGSRKGLTVFGFIFARQIWWLLLPLLFISVSWSLAAFLIIITISAAVAMLSTPGWLSWIADIVPDRIRGRYFARRNSAIAITTVLASIAGGLVLDHFRLIGQDSYGFAIIIGLGCVFAMISSLLLKRLPDTGKSSHGVSMDILMPLRDKRFRYLLRIFFFWNMAIGISAIFFAAHMLTYLKMSFLMIAIYSGAVALSGIFMNRFWGMIVDRVGSRNVLIICAFGISVIPLIWFFPRADFIWILGLESIYTGALWAGFNLAAFNMPISVSPKDKRTSYLAMFSVVTGIGFFAASLIGGIIADLISGFNLQIGPLTIINYHILFAISSLLRILASINFISFHEPGEKSFPVMFQFIGYAALKQITVGRQLFPHRVNHASVGKTQG